VGAALGFVPATVVIGMTDEDLDLLYAAWDKDEDWRLLRNIVERLEREAA
jgi:hypothetical protein